MSDVPPSAMPGGPDDLPGDGPSEEEVRAYLGQMRQAPVEQVVAEVLQGLLNAAQIKLGRRDARLLLDTAANVADQTRPHLGDALSGQIDDALNQLRMAQVEAEKQVAQSGQPEEHDIDPAATQAPPGQQEAGGQAPPSTSQPGSGATSKLWVPGR
jgi:hypothetical protein